MSKNPLPAADVWAAKTAKEAKAKAAWAAAEAKAKAAAKAAWDIVLRRLVPDDATRGIEKRMLGYDVKRKRKPT